LLVNQIYDYEINYLSIFYIMTDNSQKFDKLQERNQQVLNNISQLQIQEKQLYDSLDDVNLSSDEKQQIIHKINEISQMRMNMYASMKDMYSYYQQNVSVSRDAIGQDVAAINILENELNDAKIRMNLLENQKYNKLRSVEINTYYGKRYKAHSNLMKMIVIMCILIIILAVLANRGILPQSLYGFLTGLILIIGIVLIGRTLIDMSNRDNMNWDEYNWNFDKDKAPKDTSDGSSNNNPWSTPSITCIGSACCYDGSTYDDVKNICVPNAVYEQQQEQVEEEPVEEKEEPVEEKEEPVEEEEEPVEEEEEPVESFTGFYSYISKHNIF
jgi:hypothetical protein